MLPTRLVENYAQQKTQLLSCFLCIKQESKILFQKYQNQVVDCWSQSTQDVTRPNCRSCVPVSGVIGHSSFGTSDDEQERK